MLETFLALAKPKLSASLRSSQLPKARGLDALAAWNPTSLLRYMTIYGYVYIRNTHTHTYTCTCIMYKHVYIKINKYIYITHIYIFIYLYHVCSHMGGGSGPCKLRASSLPISSMTHLDSFGNHKMGQSQKTMV